MARQRKNKSQTLEERVFSVPARFMRPRILFMAAAIILLCFGLAVLYSASSIIALTSSDYNYNPYYLVTRQLLSALVGIVVIIILWKLDYRNFLGPLGIAIFLLTVALLIAVLYVGVEVNGAKRWMELPIVGLSFQPGEFAKPVVVIMMAVLATYYYEQERMRFEVFGLCILVLTLLVLYPILKEPDNGTAAIIGIGILAMGYLAGAPKRWIVVALGASFILFAVYVYYKGGYSLDRVRAFINPEKYANGVSYNLTQSLYAFGSGGLFGVGIGHSSQKYSYLPYASIDYIFAVVGEELGFVGTVLVMVLFAVLVWSGYEIARRSEDIAGRLIAGGATTFIWVQLMINVVGVIALLPSTGKPLPFFSYGGSALVTTLTLVGLVLSVSVHTKLPKTVHDTKRAQMLDARKDRREGLSLAPEQEVHEDPHDETTSQIDDPALEPRSYLQVLEGGARTDSSSNTTQPPSAAERLRMETQAVVADENLSSLPQAPSLRRKDTQRDTQS